MHHVRGHSTAGPEEDARPAQLKEVTVTAAEGVISRKGIENRPSHTEDTRRPYGCSPCEVTISGTNGTTATKSRKIEGAFIKMIPLSKLDSVRKFIHIIHICAKLRRLRHQQR